ncbi:MAG: hypothetical protein ABH856_04060, partial [Patescibacteria group bacterium]
GSLTITTATDNPASDILVAGSSKNKMLKIKVTASPEEDIFIKELTVRNDENLDDIALASLSLDVENDLYGISIGKFALQSNGNNAGYVTWNTSINVPANTSINLVVKGDILSSQQASVSGTTPALSVLGANDIKAVGASSGAEIVVSGKAVGNPMYVYNTKPTIAAGAASPQGASSASSGMIIGEFIVNAANNPADTGENALTIDNMDITFLKNGVSLTNVKLYPKMKDLDPAYALTPQWLTEGIVRFGEDDSTVENWANWTTSGYDKVIENSSQTYVLRADVANAANGSLLVKFGNLGTAGQSSLGEGDEPGDFDWNDGTTNGVFWVKQSSTEVKLNAATLTFASASGGM